MTSTLPTDDAERKSIPVFEGFVCYFPKSMVEVARHSQESNEQHNPGEPLYWNRAKSKNQLGSLTRHLLDIAGPGNTLDDQILHARAMAWRSMANLELLLEERDARSEQS
jgi:hypothetical protein